MPLSEEEKRFLEEGLEGGDEGSEPTDEQLRKALRDAGFDVPYTKGDLLTEIYDVYSRENPYEEAMQDFRGGDQQKKFEGFENQRKEALSMLFGAYTGKDAKEGRVFRPSTYQEPSQKSLLGAANEATMGPDPSSLFRDVFQESFPDLGEGKGPYEKFVQGQEKELESKFSQQVFNELTTPGKLDELRGDYDTLLRQQESGSFAGAGGKVPAFEDFIRGRFKSNYLTFLAAEKPKLREAFELASPDERGQRDAGQLAPKQRIL